MVKIAIIGYGYWGKNLVRNFFSLPHCTLYTVADADPKRLQSLKSLYPGLNSTSDIESIFKNPEIDAVVIATPVFTHYTLAKKALLAGKHVLVEKPMTASVKEAEELIELAQKKSKLLMVDHTFLYTGAVERIKHMIEAGEVGKINYIDSTRINLGLFQADVNVLWDLAPHDVSICFHLTKDLPYSVQARGISHTKNGIENIAYLTLNYQTSLIAHFNCSWSSPVKIRQMLIGGDRKMILYNDMEPTEKVKVYDTGFEVNSHEDRTKIIVDYRIGDIYTPKLQTNEALTGMAGDFVNAILSETEPVSNWKIGLKVVKVLEGASVSIKAKGKEVTL
ncbi:Gfo/Idh/MocA family oxidoreductase [Rhodocytophaga rosea]|uniref:Gfo/Idh/MocA family oxidoreductase n=1 Tax=Rhodocytophaga rosea TaxID=2704465 RepID=A0A6C0GLZ4_9BACT|nr:Gfo/Idh/MocA family oxidoreductase [Rhodocytophaga rosea]QHT68834.1 Gfo/Idh/MocA family oxidoreductase [Rhodocytophaga rosea]